MKFSAAASLSAYRPIAEIINMDDNIEFRFITRTFSEDYVVLCENGRRQLNDIDEFAPIRKIGNIIPEEGLCAVLFERNEKIFLPRLA